MISILLLSYFGQSFLMECDKCKKPEVQKILNKVILSESNEIHSAESPYGEKNVERYDRHFNGLELLI